MAYGLLPAKVQAQFGWLNWFLAILPWGIVVAVGSYSAILKMYAPDSETSLSKDYITKELKQMGPVSPKEWITILIFGLSILLWATEKIHGIYSSIVAVSAMVALILANIITVDDFKKMCIRDSHPSDEKDWL